MIHINNKVPAHIPVKITIMNTVKPVQNGHSKKDNIKILKTNGSLLKVKSIEECSCNDFDLH